MKKFWNLMLAALVVLGAVACTETGENLDAPKGLSFEATIDLAETRTDVVFNEGTDKWNTVWTGNETLTVKSGWTAYDFKNSAEDKNHFVCTNDGVKNLIGKSVTIFLTHDSQYQPAKLRRFHSSLSLLLQVKCMKFIAYCQRL